MFTAEQLRTIYAMQFVGTPYIYGGQHPQLGLDCSGFAVVLARAFGILPTSADMNASTLALAMTGLLHDSPLLMPVSHRFRRDPPMPLDWMPRNGDFLFWAGSVGSQEARCRFWRRMGAGNAEACEEITHVAFCLDRFSMLEAAGGGSGTVTAGLAIEHEAMVRMRPISSRPEYILIARPDYAGG